MNAALPVSVFGCLAGAVFFGLVSFLHLRYPRQMKHFRDNASLFGFQKRINRAFDERHYIFAGRLFAFCAGLMLLAALLQLVTE